MALVKCEECGNEVSDKAAACPKCGCPINATSLPVSSSAPSGKPSGVPSVVQDKQEQEVYNDSYVKITTARVIIGNSTYSTANISSVSLVSIAPGIGGPIVSIFLGLLLVLIGASSRTWVAVYFGIAIAVIGILVLIVRKTNHIVRITAAGGESDALTSHDQAYIHKIVEAINNAITKRG